MYTPMRMYSGYERPSSQTAIITKFDRGFIPEIYYAIIEEIDGRKVDSSINASLGGYEVLPGIHTVKFAVSGDNSFKNTNDLHLERTIDAKAGHQYVIRALNPGFRRDGYNRPLIKVEIIDSLRQK